MKGMRIMKRAGLSLVVLLAAMFIVTGCSTTVGTSYAGKPGIVHHVVIFWLKDHGNSNDRNRIIQAARDLAKLPGVLEVRQGVVLPSDRPVVDSSYDVAFVFSFRDTKALSDYAVNPEHRKAADEVIKPLVSKILIYDFVEK